MKRSSLLGILTVAATVAAAFMLLLTPSLTSAQTSTRVTITGTEFQLTPSSLSVTQGQTVHFTFTNAGKYPHNLKVELPSRHFEKTLFDTNLKPGEAREADFTFTTAGSWEIYCPVDEHEMKGMKGTIEVQAVGPVGMPVTGEPGTFVPLAGLLSFLILCSGLLIRRQVRSYRA